MIDRRVFCRMWSSTGPRPAGVLRIGEDEPRWPPVSRRRSRPTRSRSGGDPRVPTRPEKRVGFPVSGDGVNVSGSAMIAPMARPARARTPSNRTRRAGSAATRSPSFVSGWTRNDCRRLTTSRVPAPLRWPYHGGFFQPLTVRGLTVANRIVMSPMNRNPAPGGVPGDDIAQYYRRRVDGGIGLVVTGGNAVDHPRRERRLRRPPVRGSRTARAGADGLAARRRYSCTPAAADRRAAVAPRRDASARYGLPSRGAVGAAVGHLRSRRRAHVRRSGAPYKQ